MCVIIVFSYNWKKCDIVLCFRTLLCSYVNLSLIVVHVFITGNTCTVYCDIAHCVGTCLCSKINLSPVLKILPLFLVFCAKL